MLFVLIKLFIHLRYELAAVYFELTLHRIEDNKLEGYILRMHAEFRDVVLEP